MSDVKILIVDDDLNICELLRLYLEKNGFTTVLAHDGQSAVSIFNDSKPDLVLLDIMLPALMVGRYAARLGKFPMPP